MPDETRPVPLTIDLVRHYSDQLLAEVGASFVYLPPNSLHAGCYNVPVTDEHLDKLGYSSEAIPADDPRRATGCKVGEICRRHGFTEEVRAAYGAGVSGLQKEFPYMFADDRVVEFLGWMQDQQDFSGATWGRARAFAEANLAKKRGDEEGSEDF